MLKVTTKICMTLLATVGTLLLRASPVTASARAPFSTARRTLAFHSNTNISTNVSSSTRRSMSTANNDDSKEALLKCPSIPMRDGTNHPAIGFGTYKVGFIPASASSAVAAGADSTAGKERTAKECVLDALNLGYRFLECAEFYGNEAQVGEAIKESGVPRSELFLCSKVWTTTIEKGPDAVRAQLDQTLKDLGTDYLDLYLIHWPVPGHHVQAYKTLQEIQNETPQKIRGIGVSNYAFEDIQELEQDPDITALPLVNQIEINPFLYRKETIRKCQAMGIVMQSYRSLRDGKAMNDPTLLKIAKKHKRTVAQILGRWCVQKGFVYVPKSVKTPRMKENAQVFDFQLDNDDLELLDHLTSDETLQTFQGLYRKCVNRDTTKDGTMEGVKMEITIN